MKQGRDIFIALIDAGLDESAVMAFIEGDHEHRDALAVVEALGRDAELAEMVWAMRSDRQALSESLIEMPSHEPDEALIAKALDSAFPGELDSATLHEIEETGIAEKPIVDPIYRPAKRRPIQRRKRSKSSVMWWAVPLSAAATVVIGILAIWNMPAPHQPTGNAGPGPSVAAEGGSDKPTGQSRPAPAEVADAAPDPASTIEELPLSPTAKPGPRVITSPAEALRLARQGRLVIRLASGAPATTRTLVDDLTMTAALSRFASIDGALDHEQSQTIAQALPSSAGPILASDAHPGPDGAEVSRQRVGVYMLRVEPTERAFMLLFAKLRTYDRAIVEVIATAEPVTTPGSASDVSRLHRSPGQWEPKISMPVVVEEIN